MGPTVPTRILVVSDTHGGVIPQMKNGEHVDVAIHCGDLTEESKLDEFRQAALMMQSLNADLKLVIAGNHDWTLDDSMFSKKIAEMKPSEDDLKLVEKEYGKHGDARRVIESAGLAYLDEGTHKFTLSNGAHLVVYASPYTSSLNDWGFNYDPREEHTWDMGPSVNIVITHGPPKGVLDYTARQRAGSPGLFAAVAKARPQLHCFGHIHEGWGAKAVRWIEEPSEEPSHFTDIDNSHEESRLIESLQNLRAQRFDNAERIAEKTTNRLRYTETGHCTAAAPALSGQQTLFVNAAIEGSDDDEGQLPWVIDLELSAAPALA